MRFDFKDRPSFFILYRGPEGGRRGTLIASLYVAAADDFDAGGHLDEDDPDSIELSEAQAGLSMIAAPFSHS